MSEPSPTTPRAILVVDDDVVDLAAARRAIAGAYPGVTLHEAVDAESAMAAVRTHALDCVFLDLRLPGHDGLWILKRLREQEYDLPIVVLTGQGDEATAVELMKAGASDYIPKSQLSEAQIGQSVRHALRLRAAQLGERAARLALERYATQLRALTEAAHATNAVLSVDAVLQMAADRVRVLLDAGVAVVRVILTGRDEELQSSSLAEEHRTIAFTPPRSGALAQLLAALTCQRRVSAADLEGEEAALARAVGLGLPMRGWLLAPLCARDGQVIGVIHASHKANGDFTATDEMVLSQLSEIVAGALENARLFEQATSAARARDDMVAVVSHDLRNPLNTIVMACALMLDGTVDKEPARTDTVKRVDRAARRMQSLVSDLLDVTRIDSGQLGVSRQAESAHSLVDDAVDLVAGAAHDKRIVLEKRVAPGLVAVDADRERILQVCSNLLGNAIKFTPPGGRVVLEATASPSELIFTVEDEGPGIAPEHVPHLFERYWKAPVTTKSGTGLGLYIAKGIIDAHDGRIWVENGRARGTRISFALKHARDVSVA